MKITIIITAILFIYAAFSTIFHETALVGDIGKKIGDTNLHLFGYLAYINIFVLFYPLYRLYTDIRARKDIEFYLGWILFFTAIILLSTLVLDPQNRGFVGTQISEFMSPLIGKAGLWLLWLMVMALSLVFIIDDEFKFSNLKMKRPNFSFSFAWLKNTFVFFGIVLKKIFTNPFASPALEDEMMPVLDEVEEKPEKEARKPRTKKAKAEEEAVEPAEDRVEAAKDSVAEVEDRVEAAEAGVTEIEDRVEAAEDSVAEVEDKVEAAEDSVTEAEAEVEAIEEKLEET